MMGGASSSAVTMGQCGGIKGATRATITDFEPGVDKLEFKHARSLDWHDVHISSVRGGTLVSVGDDKIELIGVRPYELHKHDFLFDF
jgi:hypothetical protein